MQSIVEVKPAGKFTLKITFKNRKRKVVDIEPFLKGPVFQPVRDPKKYAQVRVNSEFGCIEWPNGADLCPDVLYYGGPPPWAKKMLLKARKRARAL